MRHLKLLMEDLKAGLPVRQDQIDAALKDIRTTEAILASMNLDGLVVIENPVQTAQDDTIHQLGEIFMILQSLVLEMRQKGALELLHGDIAERLIDAKVHLLKHNYEPAKLGKLDALKLRPVTYKKPPEQPENPQGPPY